MTTDLIAIAAMFVALGPGDGGATAPRNDSICQRTLQADLFFLSGDQFRGRLTATPENDLACAFIVSRFQRLGLAHVGSAGSYDQRFNLVTASLGPANHLDPPRARLRPGQDYIPLPFSPTGERKVARRPVFVGFGIVAPEHGRDDYQGHDVRDQFALVLLHEPGENDPHSPFDGLVMSEAANPLRKALTAQKKGAEGILFVSDVQNHPEPEDFAALARSTWPDKPPRIPQYLLQDWVDRVRIPAVRISTALARDLLREAGLSLEDLARAAETPRQAPASRTMLPMVELATDVRHHVVHDRNVLAALEGSDPKLKDEWVVVACHQDHNGADGDQVFNGADDNGSGMVGMLGIAEAYALAAREGHRPKRSILFAAFNSEERGLLGSWAFVERPPVPLNQIAAVLNMDMIGRDEEVPEGGGPRFRGLPVQSAESNHNAVNLLGHSRSASLTRTIEHANAAIGLTLKKVLDNNPSNLLRRSDQWPFLQKGVPAMFFHTGLHPDYHTPGDRPERINYPKLERIARLVHQASWDLAQQSDRPRLDASAAAATPAADASKANGPDAYLAFIRQRAAALRAHDAPPRSLADWTERRAEIRRRLVQALGPVPDPPPPLDPRIHGTLERDGYRVEKWTFQTLPGVRMTANLYLPNSPGKHPAILAVHGHWRGAKQDPVVQSRCIAAVKLGFVVLAVDAFGAGERGIGRALGEYHGAMTAATLLPTGQTLAGLQVYENGRALAYLATRPEVDVTRIGVSGASGGGNQTMYAIAMLDGLKAAVPVCSVGNYQSYLGTGCCVCEVVPGALTFTEEWGVLGLAAPKPLMVVNATRDAAQFSVPEARKTIAGLGPLYRLYGDPQNLRHATFESNHDYNQAMRQAAYGWFARHLAGRGDGAPIAEPAVRTEDPETLRCFPGESRRDDFVTLPRYAAAEGRRLVGARAVPSDAGGWKAEAQRRRARLVTALGGFPDGPPAVPRIESGRGGRVVRFEPEPGIALAATVEPATEPNAPRAILLDLDGAAVASASPMAAGLRKDGWALVTLDLRATGRLAVPSDKVGDAPDHNSAEWGLWIGRPLLGQWVQDIRRLLDALDAIGDRPSQTALIGIGKAGLVALAAAATDSRIARVATVGALASYISEEPYHGQRLGVMVPGLLRDVGDVPHLAALVAPRRVLIAGGVSGIGRRLDASRLREAFEPTARAFGLFGAADALEILDRPDAAVVLNALR